MTLLAIGLGGAVGSLLRFWLSTSVQARLGMAFPFGTISVNILGSFLIGAVFVILQQKSSDSEFLRAFLIIGLLGGFTTFSAFSLETLNLIHAGFWYRAMLNIIGSVAACLVAVAAGIFIGRYLERYL